MAKAFRDPKTGKWFINASVRKADGGFLHLHKRGYATKREAEEDVFSQTQEILLRNGEKYVTNDDFSTIVDEYKSWESSRVRYHTMDNQIQVIREYIEPEFAHKRVSDVVDEAALKSWRDSIVALPFTGERKNFVIRIMREIVTFGYETGKVTPLAMKKSKISLVPYTNDSSDVKREKRALTPEEYKAFIKTFDPNDRYKILFETFFYLGCRCSELQGLQWKDVSEKDGTVYIHQQIQYFKSQKKSIITPTKTKSSVRYINLSPFILKELKALKEAYCHGPDDFLFFGKSATTKTPIVEQLIKHCDTAKIGRISPHEIRHTVASWLVANCKDMSDLIVVQRWLGHSSLKETLDTYSHYLKKTDKPISEVIERIQAG
jgi:integrase